MFAVVLIVSLFLVTTVLTWVRTVLLVIGPTNWLDAYLHTRRGMKWGLVICLPLAAACVSGARLIEANSTPGDYAVWQMLLWALLWFDAMKLVRMGIVSVVLLARARFREWAAVRRGRWEVEAVRSGVVGAPGDR
ncbi:hypothetical protein Xcel_0857 [Xylanimonas cellulosilytica DSM 15894]|uniref:Transmembrane protein n=1 Tax=Xylanimonas cellulosilytica (strain DSM 15894 / JCM 12276 / CECT 5975 / KCTC 9989 / LMG 20990 / NBRC 107835 / XIL07) TaxID=446471 RepID=D1BY47_XYLCX|nr:hypothetical protein [Xylanimonas cellulosilytica]ACZ29890.1 hypothetical protein Xcel_0857 [Xylanimonas cellulosilytica DSM 15894]